MQVRPYPYARWPRIERRRAIALGRVLHRWPLEDPEAALGVLADLTGMQVQIQPGVAQLVEDEEGPTAPWSPWPLAIVLAHAEGEARLLIELETGLALTLVAAALGARGPEPGAPVGPLSDGERGVLTYLVARALGAGGRTSWRVAGVVSTAKAIGTAAGPGPFVTWPAHVTVGGTSGAARVRMAAAMLDRLSERASRPRADLGRLEMTMVVEAGRADLGADELRSIRPGDVVVLDEALCRPWEQQGREMKVRVRIAGARRTSWWCIAREGELRLEEVERSAEVPTGEGRPMDESDATHAIIDRAGDAPVQVTVELARFTLPLERLGAIQPGEVLLTGRAVGERVVLRAGDRAVGIGELVDVEGEVGVRVLSV